MENVRGLFFIIEQLLYQKNAEFLGLGSLKVHHMYKVALLLTCSYKLGFCLEPINQVCDVGYLGSAGKPATAFTQNIY